MERTYDVHITLMMSDIGESVEFRSPTIRIFNYLPKSKILSTTGSHLSTQLEETKGYH